MHGSVLQDMSIVHHTNNMKKELSLVKSNSAFYEKTGENQIKQELSNKTSLINELSRKTIFNNYPG